MPRVRVSTTVDEQLLARARKLVGDTDSKVLDQALAALIESAEAAAELRALDARPYEDDDEVAWTTRRGEPLPYDGQIPPEVLALAEQRRASG